MPKLSILNRNGQKISILLENEQNGAGLAFLMPGMGYPKEDEVVKAAARGFISNGYTVVSFDQTNNMGESDGSFEDATITNYYTDLEDVVEWARTQPWHREPFVLSGHSVGGTCSVLYAQKFRQAVKGLVLIAPLTSGEAAWAVYPKELIDAWREKGILEWDDNGVRKRVKWQCHDDALKYDLSVGIENLLTPTTIIVGDQDTTTPLRYQQQLYDSISNARKNLELIRGAKHIIRGYKHLAQLESAVDNWVKTL